MVCMPHTVNTHVDGFVSGYYEYWNGPLPDFILGQYDCIRQWFTNREEACARTEDAARESTPTSTMPGTTSAADADADADTLKRMDFIIAKVV